MAKEQNKDPKFEDLEKTKLDADKAGQVKGGTTARGDYHIKG
ncbi:MAG TPA: hypothetical protein VJN95_00055 [Gemmatimonadales bacterium]|nr:hypothetical protein [Gemmatimonadales bacterium]